MQVDLPEVLAEVRAEFERYEKALVTNDVDALDKFFRDDPRTVRYGVNEKSWLKDGRLHDQILLGLSREACGQQGEIFPDGAYC